MTLRRGRPAGIILTPSDDDTLEGKTTVQGITFSFRRGADGRVRSVGFSGGDADDRAYARGRVVAAMSEFVAPE